jgi:hypothetical protein
MIRLLLIFLMFSKTASAGSLHYPTPDKPKYITINVTYYGLVYMAPDTLSVSQLPTILQQRLWKSWLGTGKMYDGINLKFDEDTKDEIRLSVLNAIKAGQERALAEVCVQKYKKSFGELSESQRQKIKKNFPVLFQQAFP